MANDHEPGATTTEAAASAPPGTKTRSRPAAAPPASGARTARRLVRRLMLAAILLAVSLAGGWALLEAAVARLDAPPLAEAEDVSTTVVDRNGKLLRAFTTADGRWRLPVTTNEVDPRYLALLLAFEDRRFHQHSGVDPVAVARASWQFLTHGRIVSGASTLSMQVARLLDRRHERSLDGKLSQALRAIQLERRFTKAEILDLYLRLAPFGGNIEGARAASLAYFGKEPQRLSLGEAALLVALPQSPEARRPDRNATAARRARDRVLDRAVAAGLVSTAEALRAKAEAVPDIRRAFPMLAPHLAEAEVALRPRTPVIKLTIERETQALLQSLLAEQTPLLGDSLSAALLAVDHATGEIVAHVGSASYLDKGRRGAIDMTRAVRSPGSTLKPFIYGLGFEAGLGHPETLIEDRPARFGGYRPENFDEGYRGTITIREALGASLNVPAVRILDALGPTRLTSRLRRAGARPVMPEGARPGLPIALGGLGMTLHDLATLYAGLANGGQAVALTHRYGEARQRILSGQIAELSKRRLMSGVAAWYVTDILKDAPPPAHTRSGRIAYKTGTSYGYRDALAVGFDGRHVIAVWVGRADGAPTPGLTGRTAAAPLLFDAFGRLGETRAPLPRAPSGALKVASGAELPPPLKRFGRTATSSAGPFREEPVLIAFPPDRSELAIEGSDPDPLLLKAEGGVLPLTWLIDGQPIASEPHRRDVVWQPDGPGFARLSVVDAAGRVDRVTVRLRE